MLGPRPRRSNDWCTFRGTSLLDRNRYGGRLAAVETFRNESCGHRDRMSVGIDARMIVGRIRGLIAGHDRGDLRATARRLGVDLLALERTVDLHSPRPSFAVLAAVARTYRIDPKWLLYGESDPTTHSIAAEPAADIAASDLVELAERRTRAQRKDSRKAPPPIA